MIKLILILLFMNLNFLKNFMNFNNKKSLKIMKLFNQNFLMFLVFLFLLKFNNTKKNYWMMINMNLGYDYLSWSLIILTMWISFLMILTINQMNLNKSKMIKWILLMMFIIIMSFLMMNMFFFYLFFEISLIPIMILIMGWGTYENRISASFYMLMYTLLASMPLLLILFFLFNKNFSLFYPILTYNFIYFNSMVTYTIMFMSFFVKMPMYMVHMWLPKAHVEASVIGSMILAAVLLKLGSYGFYRFLILMKKISMKINFMIISLNLIGAMNLSLICLNQIDMKLIIAYSSVVHMSLLIMSSLTLMKLGFDGSIYLMMAHGICSSGMFFMVNLSYEKSLSRLIFINKGSITTSPMITTWWFLICICNMSSPPSMNLLSEILMLTSMIMWNKILIINLILICFLSSCYTLFIYSTSQHGKPHYMMNFNNNSTNKNYLLLILHWIPLNLMFLNFFLS